MEFFFFFFIFLFLIFLISFSDFSYFFCGERERERERGREREGEREEMRQCVSSRNEMKLLTFVKKVMTIPFESMSGCHSKRKNGMGTFSVKEEVVT